MCVGVQTAAMRSVLLATGSRSMGRDEMTGTGSALAVARLVREELARRRISRQGLAALAQVSLSTLEKGLSGSRPFTLATLVRLETALGIGLRPEPAALRGDGGPVLGRGDGTAPDALGSYSRAAVTWLEGVYLTLRPSFGESGAVYAYRTDIRWDESSARLVFHEGERVDSDFTQFGEVAVPHQSGHIYLVTNRHGQHRMVVVARPTISGEMHGLLTTLQAGRGAHLSPIATPIVLKPLSEGTVPAFGRVARGYAAYPGYRALLRRTLEDHFAALLPD